MTAQDKLTEVHDDTRYVVEITYQRDLNRPGKSRLYWSAVSSIDDPSQFADLENACGLTYGDAISLAAILHEMYPNECVSVCEAFRIAGGGGRFAHVAARSRFTDKTARPVAAATDNSEAECARQTQINKVANTLLKAYPNLSMAIHFKAAEQICAWSAMPAELIVGKADGLHAGLAIMNAHSEEVRARLDMSPNAILADLDEDFGRRTKIMTDCRAPIADTSGVEGAVKQAMESIPDWSRTLNYGGYPERSLRFFQTNLPWSIRYSTDFRSSPLAHKDFAHALHHVSKAAGKLHGLVDDTDHDRALADDTRLRDQYGKYVADLVVCALRMANTFPGGVLDLQAATHHRIEDKNGVKLP